MNKKLLAVVQTSIETLQKVAPQYLPAIKTALSDVHHNKYSSTMSYFSLLEAGKIQDPLQKIYYEFCIIGFLIAIPAQGATFSVKKAYKEDVKDPSAKPLIDYQMEVADQVYELILNMDCDKKP